jgi:hypothetical protein
MSVPMRSYQEQPRVLRSSELIRAVPQRAVEKAPADWSNETNLYFAGDQPDLTGLHSEYRAPGLWKVEGPRGLLREVPGKTAGRLDPRNLAATYERVPLGSSSQPRWLDKTYLPQVVRTAKRRMTAVVGRQLQPMSFPIEWPEIMVDAWPWCTIGRVDFSNGQSGSGVLVGRSILLTCSHGVPWGQSPWWINFKPALFDSNTPFGTSFVSEYWGYQTDPAHISAWDYVVCRLYDPLGDRCGYMGYYGTTDDDFYLNTDSWITVGYPGTPRPQTEYFIDIDDVDDSGDASELETPWDSMPGWSGGPLFGWINDDPKVLGVVSGNEIDSFPYTSDHGVFAGGLAMARLVEWARANWS